MSDTTPATPFIHLAQNVTELEDWGPLPEATGPEMATSGYTLWKGDGDQEVGIWECTPGPSRWLLDTHEFIQVVAGAMTCRTDAGETVELVAGDTAGFPRGWSGTWDIEETLRKVYVIF